MSVGEAGHNFWEINRRRLGRSKLHVVCIGLPPAFLIIPHFAAKNCDLQQGPENRVKYYVIMMSFGRK